MRTHTFPSARSQKRSGHRRAVITVLLAGAALIGCVAGAIRRRRSTSSTTWSTPEEAASRGHQERPEHTPDHTMNPEVDEWGADSFPASDPPPTTPGREER